MFKVFLQQFVFPFDYYPILQYMYPFLVFYFLTSKYFCFNSNKFDLITDKLSTSCLFYCRIFISFSGNCLEDLFYKKFIRDILCFGQLFSSIFCGFYGYFYDDCFENYSTLKQTDFFDSTSWKEIGGCWNVSEFFTFL